MGRAERRETHEIRNHDYPTLRISNETREKAPGSISSLLKNASGYRGRKRKRVKVADRGVKVRRDIVRNDLSIRNRVARGSGRSS